MTKAESLRFRQKVKSVVPIDNAVKKHVSRPSTLYEGRFIIKSNHAKMGVQHFSV
jgi:hypothetical protein